MKNERTVDYRKFCKKCNKPYHYKLKSGLCKDCLKQTIYSKLRDSEYINNAINAIDSALAEKFGGLGKSIGSTKTA